MCGIAGVMTVDGTPPAAATLDRLERALAHRGPDGHGRLVRGDTALVHTRLAIIDLTTGDQPLFDKGGAALVANGEIYNHPELRQGLLADADFATHSDCETILPLYRRYGLDCLAHLRGMYAFALHDPDAGSLFLARDPFGIKPLYYTEGAFGFAFASEPQALIAAGLAAAEVERRAVGELLQLQFTTGADSIFKDIHRLLPGEALLVKGGRVTERRRQPALPAGRPKAMSEVAALAELDRVLTDSVLVHQRSDVPYGLFLSSGIDSTAILAVMARLNDS
ncbi:MAG TPA: asparagine synthetase B, partial [Rhodospirillaceae bacterium]|nr:asparagine synthetase B [Rhodospirillaceae bacterium]